MKFMPRLYAVQVHSNVTGWEDSSYYDRLAPANQAAKEYSERAGRITRVVRKSHNFVPPPPVLRDPPFSTPVFEIGRDLPVEYIRGITLAEPDPEKLRKKHQKKLSRERAAVARIPTWYDRINSESEE